MKKRDLYILAFLTCLIIYATFNRKEAIGADQNNINDLRNQSVKTEINAVKPDSIQINSEKIIKAGI